MSGGLDGGLSTPLDYLASQRHSRHTSELPAAAAQPAAAAADAAQLQQLRSQVDEERSKAGLLIISLQEVSSDTQTHTHNARLFAAYVPSLEGSLVDCPSTKYLPRG